MPNPLAIGVTLGGLFLDIVVPRPIDPARTVLRIDLRDLDWSAKTWTAVAERNPYFVRPESDYITGQVVYLGGIG